MEAIVRFSRPILVKVEVIPDIYHTVYGFIIDEKVSFNPQNVEGYVGYMAGMSIQSNGGRDLFSPDHNNEGVPFWEDSEGNIHYVTDDWGKAMGEKCRQMLNLCYSLTYIEKADRLACDDYVDEYNLITSERFFTELERNLKKKGSNCTSDTGKSDEQQ